MFELMNPEVPAGPSIPDRQPAEIYESPEEGEILSSSASSDTEQREDPKEVIFAKIRQRQDTNTEPFYVYGSTREAAKPLYQPNPEDNPILLPAHPEHDKIAWVSCYDFACPAHQAKKLENNCFPERTGEHPIRGWYEERELAHHRVTMRLQHIRIFILERRDDYYPRQCVHMGRLDRCIREECLVHQQDKVNEWHRRKGTRPRALSSLAADGPSPRKEGIETWLKNLHQQTKNQKRRL
jgi:hypothetical protein